MKLRQLAAGFAALAYVAGPAIAACPNVGLKTQRVAFVTATGRHRYTIEIAATGPEQECGMMFRKTMPRSRGMAFPFAPPKAATFWMENTPLPLDLVFIGPDKRVVSIGKGKPFSRDFIDSGGIIANVIELNAGEAARIGLKPGDRVEP